MKISEAMEITSLTKKAINYYEENGLINPCVNSLNNYREYSKENIDKLIQISVLRQFDISVKDIKVIIQKPEMLKEKFQQQLTKINAEAKRLEQSKVILNSCLNTLNDFNVNFSQLTKQLSILNKSLEMDERTREGFMKRQLDRIFPGKFGRLMTVQYSQFLNEPIDTKEKEEAWVDLVKFLDEVESIEYSKDIENLSKQLTNEEIKKYKQITKRNIEKWISIDDKGLIEEKERLFQYAEKMKSDTEMQKQWKETCKINEQLTTKMRNIDFHNKFSENLKVLSSDYREYIKKMNDFCKLIDCKIDDDGNLVVSEK
jgi:DNA-binding transcriptional MerR regulator